ncbi:sterol-binding protein [Arsukibacterium sp. MJ3]|uniref:ubiquinone anaerobic biosynthesis accessory factor UbiT n=1 Tax=Arsukibacterium sp. MJ3 TaxID=1632859 RepID=UPI000626FB04|nr:SCP2 sterol-binding domain-containing protein [Arsukibacterium sp. MJ3]KKO49771.1 sterol-binding protein [Arsukibacterium sp. MJ3]
MIDIKRVNYKLVSALPTTLRQLNRYAPKAAQVKVLQLAINQFFKKELQNSELDFLQEKQLVIVVSDIALQFGISLNDRKLQVQLNPTQPALLLTAELADFVAMMSNTTDPDTLFFRRRLQLLGDTELGLYCKNLLDSIGPDRLPPLLSEGLSWLAQQHALIAATAD